MRKYDINEFYLGIVHVGYKMNLFSNDNQDFQVANKEHVNLRINGAVDLDKIDSDYSKEGYVYKRLLTIFYHVAGNEYLCLHNHVLYCDEGQYYYSNLTSIKDYLPKMAFEIKNYISFTQALDLFSMLFSNKKMQFLNTFFPIQNFYLGEIEACDKMIVCENKYPYKKFDSPINVPESRLLLPYYQGSGYVKNISNENSSQEYFFSAYDTIFYVQNNVCYSLDSHQVYSSERKSPLDAKIRINCALEEKLINEGINYHRPGITLNKVMNFRERFQKRK